MLLGWRGDGWRCRKNAAVLLIGYGLSRFAIEYVRQPDPQLGILMGLATMGQLLCLPMMAAGGFIIWNRRRQ